jgi:hypothetical protein
MSPKRRKYCLAAMALISGGGALLKFYGRNSWWAIIGTLLIFLIAGIVVFRLNSGDIVDE